jgi:hypothetical protein
MKKEAFLIPTSPLTPLSTSGEGKGVRPNSKRWRYKCGILMEALKH